MGGPAVRFHVGLEDPADLIADLAQALTALPGEGSQALQSLGEMSHPPQTPRHDENEAQE